MSSKESQQFGYKVNFSYIILNLILDFILKLFVYFFRAKKILYIIPIRSKNLSNYTFIKMKY